MLENIFTTVLNMSITASMVSLVIILVRTVFHKSLPKLFSRITQNEPISDGGNLKPKKPKGFKW